MSFFLFLYFHSAKTNATSRLGYPVGRYQWLIDYEPKCDIFEPTNVTLTLSRCDQVKKLNIFKSTFFVYFTPAFINLNRKKNILAMMVHAFQIILDAIGFKIV